MINYSDVDNLMILGVHTNKNLLSRIIRWFTGQYYQHSGTVVRIKNKIWIFEEVEEGAVLTPFEDYIKTISEGIHEVAFYVVDMEEVNINETTTSKWLEFVKKYKGIPYDFENLLLNQPVKILLKEWIGSTGEDSKKRMICNELTYNHLQYTFPTDLPNIGYKANWNDIIKYVIQGSNNITKKNINQFLNK